MINGSITQRGGISGGLTAGVGGTTDYTELENKPSINNVELIGNKNAHDLDLANVQDVATLTGQLSDLSSNVALMGQKLPKNYSTDEQATGQHWIDGKIIYKKTITFAAPIGQGNHQILDVSNLNIDKIIDIKGMSYLNSSGNIYNYIVPNLSSMLSCELNFLHFNVKNDNWAGYTVYATLYYTKNEV